MLNIEIQVVASNGLITSRVNNSADGYHKFSAKIIKNLIQSDLSSLKIHVN
ncbi:hypothetical protein D083_3964 [Dickeya solani RNS 08.23.3.1.A]|nr:hypothetical protein D083_3964 [Dickeya solani RNS 08.23.3.1.A]